MCYDLLKEGEGVSGLEGHSASAALSYFPPHRTTSFGLGDIAGVFLQIWDFSFSIQLEGIGKGDIPRVLYFLKCSSGSSLRQTFLYLQ